MSFRSGKSQSAKISSKNNLANLITQIENNEWRIVDGVDLLGSVLLKLQFRNLYIVGLGKSEKIAITAVSQLNSVGFNAKFISVSDFLHGSLNVLNSRDMILYVSKSGDTLELLQLAECCLERDICQILITHSKGSALEFSVDHTIRLSDSNITEMDCRNLIPSTSNIIFNIFFNLLTVYLVENQSGKFNYVKGHPNGTLGKKKQEPDDHWVTY